MNIRRTVTATAIAAGLAVAPIGLAPPAGAVEKEFRVSGADVDFGVERERGNYDVDLDIDDAAPRSKWRVTLWQNGKRFYKNVLTADSDGDVRGIDRTRPNTRGRDTFKVKVTRFGGGSKSRTLRVR